MSKAWFKDVFGFDEHGFAATRAQFELQDGPEGKDTVLLCKANNKVFKIGKFETPTVGELKQRVAAAAKAAGTAAGEALGGGMKFSHKTKVNVESLIREASSEGHVFMAASQTNCLEMVGPGVSPNSGVTQYFLDPTQGPKVAMSAPGSLIYRNYFAPKGRGQHGDEVVSTIERVEKLIDNEKNQYWHVQNGYLLPTSTSSMRRLASRIGHHSSQLGRNIIEEMQAGIQWNTEVNVKSHSKNASPLLVCQVYSSAVPVGYAKSTTQTDWASFATLVLEGAYTANLLAGAALALERKRRVTVYLTAIGSNAFGNNKIWVAYALNKALFACKDYPVDAVLCHHGSVVESAFNKCEVPKIDPWLHAVEIVEKEKEEKESATSATSASGSKASSTTAHHTTTAHKPASGGKH